MSTVFHVLGLEKAYDFLGVKKNKCHLLFIV